MPWKVIEQTHPQHQITVLKPAGVAEVLDALAALRRRRGGGKIPSDEEARALAGRFYVWHKTEQTVLGTYVSHSKDRANPLETVLTLKMRQMPLEQSKQVNRVLRLLFRNQRFIVKRT